MYSSTLRRCQLLHGSPTNKSYQPRKRTLEPGAHVERSLSSTRFDGTGAVDMMVKAQKAVETMAGVRCARAKVSASDIIPSCIQARFMTSPGSLQAFQHRNSDTIPPRKLPPLTTPRSIFAFFTLYVHAAYHPAAPPSHSSIGTRSAYPSLLEARAISPELIENPRAISS